MKPFYLILIAVFMAYCKSPENKKELKLTRIEMVKNMTERSLTVSDDIQNEIKKDILKIIEEIDSVGQMKLFWKSTDGKITEINKTWESVDALRDDSYNLWKDHDVRCTYILFPGIVQNAETGEMAEIYAVEVEHNKLTGMCIMNYNPQEPGELKPLKYIEREE